MTTAQNPTTRPAKTQAKYDRLLVKYGVPCEKGAYKKMDNAAILQIFEDNPESTSIELGWKTFGVETSDNLVKALRDRVGAPPSPHAHNQCSTAMCRLDKLAEKRKMLKEQMENITVEIEEANKANDAELAVEEQRLEDKLAKIRAARGK